MAENNENIVHVSAIEGLAMQIAEHLRKIQAKNPKEQEIKWEAQEFLNMYQANQLHELREAFE